MEKIELGDFYQRTYPLMATALKMAKAKGHTIRAAERLGTDPGPGRISGGLRWKATCEECGQHVWAALESAGITKGAQIVVGGPLLLMTCGQVQRLRQKYGSENATEASVTARPAPTTPPGAGTSD